GQSSARPIHIQADTLVYSKTTQTYEGKGSVVVVQGPYHLDADEATLNVATGQVMAVGRVHLNDGFSDIHGERLDFNFNTTKGVIFHGRLFVLEGNFTVDAQVMERLSEEQYRMEDASFTTCSVLEGERTPWQFKADKAELELEGFLYARSVQFCILDVPVMYLPAVLFPTKRERATGFLMPITGSSSVQGFKIREAFFWDISPSQDATAALDYRGKLGTGADLEYRYRPSRDSDTYMWGRYFRDTQQSTSRWDLITRHVTKFSEDLQGRIAINYVNERTNLQVLSENVLQRVVAYQESQAFLSKRWDNQVLYGLTRYSQNLTTLSDKTVLQTFPEVGYSLSPVRLGGIPLYAGLDTTFDSFYRQQGLDAQRADLFPRMWAPIPVARYGTVTPLAGFRETFYSRGFQTSDPVTKEALYLSLTADTRLSRRFEQPGGNALTHKIEPALTYEYLPQPRQSGIPVFNDVDSFAKKNLLTYSLTNRFSTMAAAGETRRYLEFGYLRLTQSEHLTSSPTGKPWSDLRTEGIARIMYPLPVELDVDTFYNHALGKVSAVNTDLRVTLTNELFLTIGQRFTRPGPVAVRGDLFNPMTLNDVLVQDQTTHFYNAEVGVALPYNFYAVVRGFLDQNARTFPEVDYGLYYVNPSRCWGVGFLFLQQPTQTEYAFVFTLGGVGYTESPLSAVYEGLFQRLGLDIQKLRGLAPPPSSARPF
ncbi:MAG TPA: LPS assembly protein LptD, partial [Nitrospirales bacterium]|nr:LPS assembly protein LptD [Nitrospirales bacterium]